MTSMGKPMKRRGPPPCEYDSCPKGTWWNKKELFEINVKALIHYEECKATNSFPDDPIVKRNARIIGDVLDNIEKIKQLRWILDARRNERT